MTINNYQYEGSVNHLNFQEQLDTLKMYVNNYDMISQTIGNFTSYKFEHLKSENLTFGVNMTANMKQHLKDFAPFFSHHIRILNKYIEQVVAKQNPSTFNFKNTIEYIANNSFLILFSYNNETDDFITKQDFSNKLTYLYSIKALNDKVNYNFNKYYALPNKYFFLKTLIQARFYAYSSYISDYFNIALSHQLAEYYTKEYLNNTLDEIMNESLTSTNFQNIFKDQIYFTDISGYKSKIITNFSNALCEKVISDSKNNPKVFWEHFKSVFLFLKSFDKIYYKRGKLKKLMLHAAHIGTLQEVSELINFLRENIQPNYFEEYKKILNDNCEGFQVVNLFDVQDQTVYIKDIIFSLKDIDLIFHEIDLYTYSNSYFFIEKLNEEKIKLRILLNKPVSLNPERIIEIIQTTFKSYDKQKKKTKNRINIDYRIQNFNQNISNEAINTVLRLIILDDNMEQKEDNKIKSKKGKI